MIRHMDVPTIPEGRLWQLSESDYFVLHCAARRWLAARVVFNPEIAVVQNRTKWFFGRE